MRDDANLNQLLVLANMESYNAILTQQDKPQSERLVLLRELAVKQMQTLSSLDTAQIAALPGSIPMGLFGKEYPGKIGISTT